MTAVITMATYLGARRELLISCRRYRSYAEREPERRDHFMGWLKLKQRQLAQLRADAEEAGRPDSHAGHTPYAA